MSMISTHAPPPLNGERPGVAPISRRLAPCSRDAANSITSITVGGRKRYAYAAGTNQQFILPKRPELRTYVDHAHNGNYNFIDKTVEPRIVNEIQLKKFAVKESFPYKRIRTDKLKIIRRKASKIARAESLYTKETIQTQSNLNCFQKFILKTCGFITDADAHYNYLTLRQLAHTFPSIQIQIGYNDKDGVFQAQNTLVNGRVIGDVEVRATEYHIVYDHKYAPRLPVTERQIKQATTDQSGPRILSEDGQRGGCLMRAFYKCIGMECPEGMDVDTYFPHTEVHEAIEAINEIIQPSHISLDRNADDTWHATYVEIIPAPQQHHIINELVLIWAGRVLPHIALMQQPLPGYIGAPNGVSQGWTKGGCLVRSFYQSLGSAYPTNVDDIYFPYDMVKDAMAEINELLAPNCIALIKNADDTWHAEFVQLVDELVENDIMEQIVEIWATRVMPFATEQSEPAPGYIGSEPKIEEENKTPGDFYPKFRAECLTLHNYDPRKMDKARFELLTQLARDHKLPKDAFFKFTDCYAPSEGKNFPITIASAPRNGDVIAVSCTPYWWSLGTSFCIAFKLQTADGYDVIAHIGEYYSEQAWLDTGSQWSLVRLRQDKTFEFGTSMHNISLKAIPVVLDNTLGVAYTKIENRKDDEVLEDTMERVRQIINIDNSNSVPAIYTQVDFTIKKRFIVLKPLENHFVIAAEFYENTDEIAQANSRYDLGYPIASNAARVRQHPLIEEEDGNESAMMRALRKYDEANGATPKAPSKSAIEKTPGLAIKQMNLDQKLIRDAIDRLRQAERAAEEIKEEDKDEDSASSSESEEDGAGRIASHAGRNASSRVPAEMLPALFDIRADGGVNNIYEIMKLFKTHEKDMQDANAIEVINQVLKQTDGSINRSTLDLLAEADPNGDSPFKKFIALIAKHHKLVKNAPHDHILSSKHRRIAIQHAASYGEKCKVWIHVGGTVTREFESKRFNIFINPIFNSADNDNTAIIQALSERYPNNIRLIPSKFQDVDRAQLIAIAQDMGASDEDILTGFFWSFVCSTWYVADHILTVAAPRDIVSTVGHIMHAESTIVEHRNQLITCSDIQADNWSVKMSISSTQDKYEHSARTMQDFVQLVGDDIKLRQCYRQEQIYNQCHEVVIYVIEPRFNNDQNVLYIRHGTTNATLRLNPKDERSLLNKHIPFMDAMIENKVAGSNIVTPMQIHAATSSYRDGIGLPTAGAAVNYDISPYTHGDQTATAMIRTDCAGNKRVPRIHIGNLNDIPAPSYSVRNELLNRNFKVMSFWVYLKGCCSHFFRQTGKFLAAATSAITTILPGMGLLRKTLDKYACNADSKNAAKVARAVSDNEKIWASSFASAEAAVNEYDKINTELHKIDNPSTITQLLRYINNDTLREYEQQRSSLVARLTVAKKNVDMPRPFPALVRPPTPNFWRSILNALPRTSVLMSGLAIVAAGYIIYRYVNNTRNHIKMHQLTPSALRSLHPYHKWKLLNANLRSALTTQQAYDAIHVFGEEDIADQLLPTDYRNRVVNDMIFVGYFKQYVQWRYVNQFNVAPIDPDNAPACNAAATASALLFNVPNPTTQYTESISGLGAQIGEDIKWLRDVMERIDTTSAMSYITLSSMCSRLAAAENKLLVNAGLKEPKEPAKKEAREQEAGDQESASDHSIAESDHLFDEDHQQENNRFYTGGKSKKSRRSNDFAHDRRSLREQNKSREGQNGVKNNKGKYQKDPKKKGKGTPMEAKFSGLSDSYLGGAPGCDAIYSMKYQAWFPVSTDHTTVNRISEVTMCGNKYPVFVTNDVLPDEIVQQLCEQKRFYFDVEADPKNDFRLNCCQYMSCEPITFEGIKAMWVIVQYGPACATNARKALRELDDNKCCAIVWDANMESKVYNACFDLQIHPLLGVGAKQSLKSAFNAAFPENNAQITVDSLDFYSQYSQEDINTDAVKYAALDVIMQQMLLDNLPALRKEMSDQHNFIDIGPLVLYGDAAAQWRRAGVDRLCNVSDDKYHQVKIATLKRKVKNDLGREYAFVDCGSGKSMDECAAQVALTHRLWREKGLWETHHDEPLATLVQHDPQGNVLLSNEGVFLSQMTSYANRVYPGNNATYTTQLSLGYDPKFEPKKTAGFADKPLVWLAHRGHAWLGVPVELLPTFKKSCTERNVPFREAADCTCGLCCAPESQKGYSLINSAATAKFNARPRAAKLAGFKIKSTKLRPMTHTEANDSIQSAAVPLETKFGTDISGHAVLTGKCMGGVKLRIASEQQIIRISDAYHMDCNPKPKMYQCGFVFKDLPYQTFASCVHNVIHACISRQAKSKGYYCAEMMEKWYELVVADIDSKFHYEQLGMATNDASIFERTAQWVREHPSYTVAQREVVLKDLDKIANLISPKIQNYAEAFIKTEITFGCDIPRLISARRPGLRAISSYVHSAVAKQLVTALDDHLIIGKTPEQVEQMLSVQACATINVCLDVGSFDAAQRGLIWDMMDHLAATVVGKEWQEVWSAITRGSNHLKSHWFEMLTICCRNSGEMDTLDGNSVLSYWITIFLRAMTKKVYTTGNLSNLIWSFVVNGDDNKVGITTYKPIDSIKTADAFANKLASMASLLGFQVTIESCGLRGDPLEFCKIKMVETDGRMVGIRNFAQALAKIGWTKQRLTTLKAKKDTFKLKLISFFHITGKWPKVIELAQACDIDTTNFATYEFTTRPYDINHVTSLSHTVLDTMYGLAIDTLIADIKKNGGQFAQLVSCDHPLIFNSNGISMANKPANIDTVDRELARTIDIKAVRGLARHNAGRKIKGRKIIKSREKRERRKMSGSNSDAELKNVVTAIKQWDDWGKRPGEILLTTVTLDDSTSMSVPVYVLPSNYVLKKLNESGIYPEAAKKGILIHIMSNKYKELRSDSDKFAARQSIRGITAHNGKLGFNWDVNSTVYKPVPSSQQQFKTSAYAEFLATAARWMADRQQATYANYLNNRAKVFTKEPTARKAVEIGSDDYTAVDQRKVAGPIDLHSMHLNNVQQRQQFEELKNAMRTVQMQKEHMNKMKGINDMLREQVTNSIVVTPEQMQAYILDMQTRLDVALHGIINGGEEQYVKSMVDPFHTDAKGVRVPQLVPQETFTYTQFDNFTLSSQGMQQAGKIVIVGNFTSVRTNPIVVFRDYEGQLYPIDKPANYIKQIKQWGPNGSETQARGYGIWGGKVEGKKIYDFAQTPVLPVFNQIDPAQAGRIRVVAGGIRLFKTSKSINEGGTVRMCYRPVGGSPQTSLDRLLESGSTNRDNVKFFPSQTSDGATRAGFLAQLNYRPHKMEEVLDFASTQADFFCSGDPDLISEYGQPYFKALDNDQFEEHFGRADARGRFLGPISLIGQRTPDAPVEFINSIFENNGSADWLGAEYEIFADSLGRPHTFIIAFEAQEGITYDVEFIRHFELIPAEEATMETRAVSLMDQYSNPLDILRRFRLAQLVANPFSPSPISTGTTLWMTDPIYTAMRNDQLRILRDVPQGTQAKVSGLFGDALRWLLKTLAPGLIDRGAEAAKKWAQEKSRGLQPALTMQHCQPEGSTDDDFECAYDYETAGNDSRFADIEKNPGPVIVRSATGLALDVAVDEEDPE